MSYMRCQVIRGFVFPILCCPVLLLAVALQVGLAQAETGFRWVADAVYDDAGAAFDGVVPLLSEGKWGLMGRDGAWTVPPRYDALGRPRDRHIPVKIDGAWGIHDLSGNEVIKTIYQEIGQWAERIPAKTSQGWMVLDRSGAEVAGPLPIDVMRGNEGHCIAGQMGERAYIYDDRQGYARGFEDPFVTSQGAMRLYRPNAGVVRFSIDGKFGFVSCDWLRMLVEPDYDAVRYAQGYEKYVSFMKDGRWGLMSMWDTGPREIVPPAYAGMRDFTEKLLPVKGDNEKWGYLNPWGDMVIEGSFDQAYSFSDGIAGVQVGDKRGFVLRDGRYAAEPMFEDFWRHAQGIAPVKLDGKWGVIAFNATAPSPTLHFDPDVLAVRPSDQPAEVRISVPHKYFRQDYFNLISVNLSADGRLAATIFDDGEPLEPSPRSEVAFWDTETGHIVSRLSVPGLKTGAFLNGGRVFAVGEVTGHITFWSVTEGKKLFSVRPATRPMIRLAVSGNGEMLAAGHDEEMWVWNLRSGQMVNHARLEIRALAGDHDSFLVADGRGAAFQVAGDSRAARAISKGYFDTATEDTQLGEMNLLEAMTIAPGPTVAAVVSPLGTSRERQMVVYNDGGWDSAPLPGHLYYSETLQVSRDGTRILAFNPEAFSGYTIGDLDNPAEFVPEPYEYADVPATTAFGVLALDTVGFLADSDRLLTVGTEGSPIVDYNWVAQRAHRYGPEMYTPVFGVQATIAGKRVFWLTGDNDIRVFDLQTGQPLDPISGTRLPTDDYEPHGDLFAGSDGNVYYTSGSEAVRIDPDTLQVSDLSSSDIPEPIYKSPSATAERALDQLGVSERVWAQDSPEAGLILIRSSGGAMELIETKTGRLFGRLAMLANGDWAFATRDGFYDGTELGIAALSVADGLRARPVTEAMPDFHRPDMVRAVLAGDPDGVAAQEAARLHAAASQDAPQANALDALEETSETSALPDMPLTLEQTPNAAPDTKTPSSAAMPATDPKPTPIPTPAASGPSLPGLSLTLDDTPPPPAQQAPSLPGLSMNTDVTE